MTTAAPPRPDIDQAERLLADLVPVCDDPFDVKCDRTARWVVHFSCGCRPNDPLHCDACRAVALELLAQYGRHGWESECVRCKSAPISWWFEPL